MIKDFEYYHGVALRSIIANSPGCITIKAHDFTGRMNSYLLNERVAIHIKHSAKRLSPWQFNFNMIHLQELLGLSQETKFVWLVFICGPDGVVAVSLQDFLSITEARQAGIAPIRIDRGKN